MSLTSSKLKFNINSLSKESEKVIFFEKHNFSENQIKFIENLFKEAKANLFIVKIKYSK